LHLKFLVGEVVDSLFKVANVLLLALAGQSGTLAILEKSVQIIEAKRKQNASVNKRQTKAVRHAT
jgi:hypothetical protein